jgi:hypothetical protein
MESHSSYKNREIEKPARRKYSICSLSNTCFSVQICLQVYERMMKNVRGFRFTNYYSLPQYPNHPSRQLYLECVIARTSY